MAAKTKEDPKIFIDQLAPGTKITIHSYSQNACVDLVSHTAELTYEDQAFLHDLFKRISGTHYIALEPIHEQNLLLNFRAEGVLNDVYFTFDNKPFVWRNTSIINLQLPDEGSVHVMVNKDLCYQYNRRQFYRVWLGVGGKLQSSDNNDAKVILKDISEGGIGFVSGTDLHLKRTDMGQISFATDSSSYTFKIVIVRIEQMPDGRYSYGARLLALNELAAKIVYTKQQQALWNKKR